MRSKILKGLIRIIGCGTLFAAAVLPVAVEAAGVLTPVGSTQQPIRMESHHVNVVINNGFARTEVEQVFFNPNAESLEAIYTAPVPERGALSELTIWAGERVLQGEVVSNADADRIYEEEKAQGNDVGKVEQDEYRRYEFSVYPVPANGSVRMRYVYYEPLAIDAGVGRYVYRLEEGGTDEAAASFWELRDTVEAETRIDVQLKFAWPVARLRAPNFNGSEERVDENTLRYSVSSDGGRLNQDFVLYFMLEEKLPGRVEMIAYRESEDKPGTFMMVMTPAEDLALLEGGSDFVFALDISGSMQGKLHTLATGAKKAIEQLKPQDRFRIVVFNDQARELTKGWQAAEVDNVRLAFEAIDRLQPSGGTNVYDGVDVALARMDADRVSSLVLVTDGVTNQGIVDPAQFYKLLHGQDVRFFGFLMGNGSNWPLMRVLCEASGGHYRAVSNNDDIVGEILLAKQKIARESLHHAELTIGGVKTFDVSEFKLGKIHYGEQLVLFGRYERGGSATLRLKARLSGQEKLYETQVEFPPVDVAHPELERLWAMDQIQKIELNRMAGFLPENEAAAAVRDIGVAYQIVTDETSMIALDDDTFTRRGLERRNQDRLGREAVAAREHSSSTGARRVDAQQPMYPRSAPSVGGGGAVSPWLFFGALGVAAVAVFWKQSRTRAVSLGLAAGVLGILAASNGSASEVRMVSSLPALEQDHPELWVGSTRSVGASPEAETRRARSKCWIRN